MSYFTPNGKAVLVKGHHLLTIRIYPTVTQDDKHTVRQDQEHTRDCPGCEEAGGICPVELQMYALGVKANQNYN